MASLARALDESISSDGPLSSSLSCSLSRLADDELLRQLDSVVATQRQQLARLLLLLGEIEERRLHLSRGYSSLFDFCTAALRFSDGEAFRRIAAARLARRFPVVLGQVARGEIHLTGLVLLRDHLTDDNHAELLAAARHRSKRELQELLAERFPRPDVNCSVRKLPAPREEVASSLPSRTPAAAVVETSARTPETSSAPGVLRTSPGTLAKTSARPPETEASPTPGSKSRPLTSGSGRRRRPTAGPSRAQSAARSSSATASAAPSSVSMADAAAPAPSSSSTTSNPTPSAARIPSEIFASSAALTIDFSPSGPSAESTSRITCASASRPRDGSTAVLEHARHM